MLSGVAKLASNTALQQLYWYVQDILQWKYWEMSFLLKFN